MTGATLTPNVAARRRWSYRLIRRAATPAPTYGSPTWLALSDDDPGKLASVVIAAEAWQRGGDELVERLALEVEAMRAAFKQVEDREHQARAETHRREWSHLARFRGLSFVERRAEQIEAGEPRPGDYRGGPVPWDGGEGA